jgi:hypothetical protein
MTDKLKLYVSKAWKRDGIHSPLMFPFWGNNNDEKVSLFAKEMFDSYQFDTSLYTVVEDISQAHMVFPPYKYQWFLRHDRALWDECLSVARTANLPLLVDVVGDVDYNIEIPNAYMLRLGGYRFLPDRRRIQVPSPVDDLLERVCGGQLTIRKKSAGLPIVGFAGWAKLSFKQKVRSILKQSSIRLRAIFDRRYSTMIKGVFWRAKAIEVLQRSSRVKLNLKVRASFSGSTKTAQGDLRELRQDFVDTILSSDYGLDVRGDPNDSNRIYEVCSLGRIPVILDTERNFPFSDVVNYRDFAVIVDYKDINRMADIVADFHANVSPEKFEEMQRKAREAFEKYFRVDAQMRQIIRLLESQIPTLS